MRFFRHPILALGLLTTLGSLPALGHAATSQYVQWGTQMLQQKKYDEAIKYFTGAAKADRQDAAAYKGLGYAYAYKGDKAKAVEYLKYSLQLNPSDSSLQAYLGQLDPSAAPAPATGGGDQAMKYGDYYTQKRDFGNAVAWYTKATQAVPGSAKAWQALGNAYYGLSDKANAISAWDRAVALDPTNTTLANYLAQIKGSGAPAAAPATADNGNVPTPGVNPWVMGGTVAALGAIMLFVF